MKKLILIVLLICGLLNGAKYNIVVASEKSTAISEDKPQDSQELIFQDMLMLFLLPHINKQIDEIYSTRLNYSPDVYPYFVNVTEVKRVNGFRGFHFLITLEVVPTVGPHIPVGKDLLTFDISPVNTDNVKLLDWKHLKDPQESDFPPNYKDILKK